MDGTTSGSMQHAPAFGMTMIVAVLAIAACGGSGAPRTTTSPPHPGGIAAVAFRFVSCMRAHGYPNMPDPVVNTSASGTVVRIQAVRSAGGDRPAVAPKPIPKACRSILPAPQNASPQQQAAQDQARRSGLLSFAACMRAHGVRSFPDPTSQGQLTLAMVTGAGIDLHAVATLAAIKACEGASHGIITPAVVGQALQQTATASG